MGELGENKQSEIFNYLSVVTSIILGLGLTQLLVSCSRLILIREHVVATWLYMGWIILLFPVYCTYWWAFWDYRNHVHWTFSGFLILLIGPTGLYLITALLLPDLSNMAEFNATTHYLNIRKWFFGMWMALQIWGIMLSPWLKDGFKKSSFFNQYKYAQYFLLVALISGLMSQANSNMSIDKGIYIIFCLVLIYLLGAHRWKLNETRLRQKSNSRMPMPL